MTASLRVSVPAPFDRIVDWRLLVADLELGVNTWVNLPAGRHRAEIHGLASGLMWSAQGTLTATFDLIDQQGLEVALPLAELLRALQLEPDAYA